MISEKQHKELLREVSKILKRTDGIFKRMAEEIASALSTYRYRKGSKVWVLNERSRKKLDKVLAKYQSILLSHIKAGSTSTWQLLEKQSNQLTGKYKSSMPNQLYTALTSSNTDALSAFLGRGEGRYKLSERVWNVQRSTQRQVEAYLSEGLSVGRSSAKMARDLEIYLNRSDVSFINNGEDTKKKRSRPGKNLRPGRGVYKSSLANAKRLARNEVNLAYRTADSLRRSELPFVTGIEVKLSASHPEYDICDELKGDYPKDFPFSGWHVNCLCYTTSKTMTAKQYGAFRRGEFEPKYTIKVPQKAKDYLSEKEERNVYRITA